MNNPMLKITIGDELTILNIGLWEWVYLMMYNNYMLLPDDRKGMRMFLDDQEIERPVAIEEDC